jgi:NitT/TauT family transport system substrate-binding protein
MHENKNREDLMQFVRAAALFVTVAVGIFLVPVAEAAELEKPSLKLAVGGKSLIAYLPLTIAERRGYFTKEGLDVEINDFQGGSKSLQALVGGSADVACGAYEHTLHMAIKGQSIKAIALQANSFGLVVGVGKEKASSYKSLQDLKGMKVGVTAPGSASAIGLKMLLAKAGLPDSDVSVVGIGGGASAVVAVKSGKVDAVANFDPVISILERDAAIKTILDTRQEKDLNYLYGGPFAASAFYLQSDFVERYPKTTQAFANAVSAALAWMAKASTDEIVAAVPPEYFSGDRALYRAMVENNRSRVSPDGVISAEAAARVLSNLRAFEPSFKDARIDLARTYDNSFIGKAQKGRAK